MSETSLDWQPILHFWLGPDASDPGLVAAKQPLWYAADPATDREIHGRFFGLWSRAVGGELDGWVTEPRGALALVILLDQLSRNLERGRAEAFAHDGRALATATDLIEAGDDRELHPSERSFLYMPFEHAEDLALQRRSVELFSELERDAGAAWASMTGSSLRWARLHHEIVERFGRFPHRNRVLGRSSTPEEELYLADGGLKFGQ